MGDSVVPCPKPHYRANIRWLCSLCHGSMYVTQEVAEAYKKEQQEKKSETKVERSEVHFGCRDDIQCVSCGHDLDLLDSCKTRFNPKYCPGCGRKIKWE